MNPKPATKAFIIIASSLFIVYAALYYARIVALVVTYWHFNDFGKLFYDLQNWLGTGILYEFTPAMYLPKSDGSMGVYRNLNPPHSLFLLMPLALLSISQAYTVWVVFSVASLAWSVIAISQTVNMKWPTHKWFAFSALLFASTPITGFFLTGHVSLVLLPVVTLLWIGMRRERWILAGVCLGILASIKVFFGVFFIAAFLRRRWQFFSVAVLTLALASLSGLLVFGLENYHRWVQQLQAVAWAWGGINASLRGIVERLWIPNTELSTFGNHRGLVTPIWLVLVAGVALATAVAMKKGDQKYDFALLMLAALLLSPLGQIYYAIWLLPELVVVFQSRSWRWSGWLPGALLWYPLAFIRLAQPSPVATLTIGSVYGWGLLGVWLAFIMLQLTGQESSVMSPVVNRSPVIRRGSRASLQAE
jgi:hypothetical protein